MRVERDWLRRLVFQFDDARRFTQDSPILPEVWLKGGIEFCRSPDRRVDLLLAPHKRQTASVLAREVLERLTISTSEKDANDLPARGSQPPRRVLGRRTWSVSVNQTTVAVSLTLTELVCCVLPLTEWWLRNVNNIAGADTRKATDGKTSNAADEARREQERAWMAKMIGVLFLCAADHPTGTDDLPAPAAKSLWISNAIALGRKGGGFGGHVEGLERRIEGAEQWEYDAFQRIAADKARHEEILRKLVADAARIEQKVLEGTKTRPQPESPAEGAEPKSPNRNELSWHSRTCLWSVGLNRRGFVAIDRSVPATKADAATRVFNLRCADFAWAIVDSGIDAEHPAFQGLSDPLDPQSPQQSRVVKAYDFTRLRQLVSLDSHPSTGPNEMQAAVDLEEADRQFKRMRERLRSGQSLDWAALEPLIDITLRAANAPNISGQTQAYRTPVHDHGTHVAGILGAAAADSEYQGMCPDIRLFDLRVLNDEGRGDEFSIIAALQFIRYLNSRSDQPVIHGVNLSLSLLHDVENFACGRTPICDECERLVATGVVVVAAAGNRGYETVFTTGGELEAYRAISITDPGNAESVITVGATHRFQPHTYGVSYFSSRGPTGDGRIKPDVLAPGERIYSTLPRNGYGAKDGTSMAAPHVSGVAALLMARHREFIGQPARVKKIICETATDLGRERYFQGFGMVDALRALQRA